MLTSPERRRRYVTLDGMRGIAALFVVARHFGDLRGAPQGQFSYLAVDVFFLLSGFVLSFRYGAPLAGGPSAIQFIKGRVVRLYPLYAMGTALGLILWTAQVADGTIKYRTYVAAVAASIAMLPAPTWQWEAVKPLFPILLPAWSLFFELYVANLLFAIARGRLTSTTLIVLVAVSGVCLLVATAFHGSLDLGSTWPTLPGGAARVCFSFFAGVLIQRSHSRWPLPLRVPSWLVLLVLGGLLAPSIPGLGGRIYECLCVFLAFPALIFLGAGAVERRPWLGKALGDTSYAVYAIHYPLIRMAGIVFARAGIAPTIPVEIASIALIVAIAYALQRFYDRPIAAAVSLRAQRALARA